jgi:MFS family permease
MSTYPVEFRRGVVQPLACVTSGWNLIKDQYWLFLGITFVGIFIGSAVPFGILMGPMSCGIYLCLLRRQRGEPVSFDTLFKGFDYFKESLIAMLIQVIPIILILIPFYIIFFALFFSAANQPRGRRSGSPPPNFTLLFTLYGITLLGILIISLVIGTLFMFTFPLIVDRKLSGIAALKTSARAAIANLGGVVGLMLLLMLLGFAGVLACYIGAFFLMPISFAAIATAYRQVFPAEPAWTGDAQPQG